MDFIDQANGTPSIALELELDSSRIEQRSINGKVQSTVRIEYRSVMDKYIFLYCRMELTVHYVTSTKKLLNHP